MRFFFVLENRSEPKFGVYFWVEHLHCGVDFWDEYLNYSNGGRIHPLQFCVQTNYGCWSRTILFHGFASEFFSLSSIQGLKMSPLCSRLSGLFWSGTLGFCVANQQGEFWAGGRLLHFTFLFRVVFLVWPVN